jgi:hypothetical protein
MQIVENNDTQQVKPNSLIEPAVAESAGVGENFVVGR